MTTPGERLAVDATGMAAGGDALARHPDGRVLFVTGALPGERVAVEVTDVRRDFAWARVRDVLEPSPLRVAPPCPHVADGCGGCQWQHISVAGQRELKRTIVVDALRRLAHIDDPPLVTPVELPASGYRTTVRTAVRDGRPAFRVGGGHDLVVPEACLVAHPLVEDLLVHGRFPDAHEVIVRCGARTGDRLVAPDPPDAEAQVPDDVRRDHVTEMVAGRTWRVSAASFFQARPDGADALANLVGNAAREGRTPGRAADLFSGVGLFAGVLAGQGWSVVAVEGAAPAVADARVNLAGTGSAVVHGDVLRWKPRPAEFVVADPSRAGLRGRGVDVVVGTGAARAVLVSCDPAACGRDTALLVAAGFRLTSVTLVDLFPHTFHVEVVSVFDR